MVSPRRKGGAVPEEVILEVWYLKPEGISISWQKKEIVARQGEKKPIQRYRLKRRDGNRDGKAPYNLGEEELDAEKEISCRDWGRDFDGDRSKRKRRNMPTHKGTRRRSSRKAACQRVASVESSHARKEEVLS